MGALANLHREQSNWPAAEEHYRSSLQVLEAARGKDDPDRLRVLRDFADMLSASGRQDEASNLMNEMESSLPLR